MPGMGRLYVPILAFGEWYPAFLHLLSMNIIAHLFLFVSWKFENFWTLHCIFLYEKTEDKVT